jgi:hypothetical protein
MEIFNYGCPVTAAFGQTRHNIILQPKHEWPKGLFPQCYLLKRQNVISATRLPRSAHIIHFYLNKLSTLAPPPGKVKLSL